MKYIGLKFTTVSLILALTGCASTQQGSQSQSTPRPSAPVTASNSQPTSQVNEGSFIGAPAKNSKFAKLKLGMGKKEVEDLIGQPNDTHAYVTGKAWIPFYFGKDAYRFETFYKREGSLTFEGGGVTGSSGKLIRVTVDVNATGYANND